MKKMAGENWIVFCKTAAISEFLYLAATDLKKKNARIIADSVGNNK